MIEKISLYILPIMILAILCAGIIKKVPVYEEFIEGAKDGFKVSVSIIPYLVAIMVGVSMFKACGAMDLIKNFVGGFIPADNAYVTKLAAVMVGSSETTFYVLAVYFGSIGIKKFRYALLTGIIADITGIVLAILVSRLFFLASI